MVSKFAAVMTAMHFSLHPFIFSLLPLFLFLVFLLKWLSSTSTTTRPPHKNLPPSPQKLPVIGNLHQIGPFPHRSLHSLSQTHGPLMLLHFAAAPVVVASSAAAAREIMKTHDLIFSNRPKSTIADKLLYASKDLGFSPYGEYWRQMKSIFVLQLVNNKRIQSFRHVREEEMSNMIEKIRSCGSDVVNLSELIVELTGEVVCRVALGRKYGGVGREGRRRGFKEVLGEVAELLGVFDVGDFVPWLKWVNRVNGVYGRAERVAKELDDFIESVVEEHVDRERKGGEREGQDFVDVLLEIQRENAAGIPIHRDSVKALILVRLQAGLPFVVYPIFSAVDLIGIYQGLKHVHLQTLTKDRLEIIITKWVELGCVPSPADVSKEEGIDFMRSNGRGLCPIRIGCLDPKRQIPRLSMMTMQSLKDDDMYFLCLEILFSGLAATRQHGIVLYMREGAGTTDIIMGLLQVCHIRKAILSGRCRWEDNLQACYDSDSVLRHWFKLVEDSKQCAQRDFNLLNDQMLEVGWACKNILLSTREQARYSFVRD